MNGCTYDMSRGVVINVFDEPPAEPVELSGVQFTFSQPSPCPNLITQISFMSILEMNGRILTCESIIDITSLVPRLPLRLTRNEFGEPGK